ncbi:MAG: hypothetical protein ACXABY_31375 [Candidatus Thorarchaeota archaeon]|jgi:hypothetical protein
MNVLVACEFSGVVRDAFRRLGYNAWSCDLLPAPGSHIVGDALHISYNPFYQWDLMVAHPPCTYLCSSGLHWNKRDTKRQQKTEEALDFVEKLLDAPIDKICVENPVGCISTRIRKPDQYIQPYEFGHDASKKTGLWLKGLTLLQPTLYIEPRIVDGKKRWSNQTDSGQNKLAPSEDRWKLRSVTYQGIADQMAQQWGCKE